MTENTTKTENKETKIQIESFLQNKRVKVTPVETRDFSGQVLEVLPPGFIAENSKNSLPLKRDDNTGRFVQIFDTVNKKYTKEFPTEALTELEWFSRVYGKDLNVYAKSGENFWEGAMHPTDPARRFPPYQVDLPKDGMPLDLSNIEDMLKWKVLSTWYDSRIAPSWEDRYNRPNYMFALVDEKVATDRKKEAIELKLKATEEFNKIKGSKELMMEFLIIKDPTHTLSDKVSEDFVFSQVYDVLENNPKLFLHIVQDEDRDDKLLVYKACKAGVLRKNGDKYSTMSDEPLGKLGEVIGRLRDPERLEFRKRIEAQVENYKG